MHTEPCDQALFDAIRRAERDYEQAAIYRFSFRVVSCAWVATILAAGYFIHKAETSCPAPPDATAQHAEVMQLQPTEIRASGSEVYEL